MIVVRLKVQCQADKTADLAAAMKNVVAAARELPGVIHFDIARDLTDPDALIATEVSEDRAAMEREEALPEVPKVVELMEAGALAAPPEWTVFDIASSESPENVTRRGALQAQKHADIERAVAMRRIPSARHEHRRARQAAAVAPLLCDRRGRSRRALVCARWRWARSQVTLLRGRRMRVRTRRGRS